MSYNTLLGHAWKRVGLYSFVYSLRTLRALIIMLDPLTALSLASAVAQLTDFGNKTLKGSIKLYYSANGVDAERSDLEFKIQRLREIADKVKIPLQPDSSREAISSDEEELEHLAESCGRIASDLLSVLDAFKVKNISRSGPKMGEFSEGCKCSNAVE